MTTVNKKEIEKFSRMAEEWWDVEGKFKPLHKFNPIRIKYIKESVIENFKLQNNEKLPLMGIDLLEERIFKSLSFAFIPLSKFGL